MKNFASLDLSNPPQIFVPEEATVLNHPEVTHPMIHQLGKLAMLSQKQLAMVLGTTYYTVNYQEKLDIQPLTLVLKPILKGFHCFLCRYFTEAVESAVIKPISSRYFAEPESKAR